MGKKSRTKGAGHEREVAKELSDVLGVDAERGARNGVFGGRDVMGVPGLHVECKRRATIAATGWMDQAVRDAGDDVPVVVMRKDRGENILMVRVRDLRRFAEAITPEPRHD